MHTYLIFIRWIDGYILGLSHGYVTHCVTDDIVLLKNYLKPHQSSGTAIFIWGSNSALIITVKLTLKVSSA